jgi:hypothetical protein
MQELKLHGPRGGIKRQGLEEVIRSGGFFPSRMGLGAFIRGLDGGTVTLALGLLIYENTQFLPTQRAVFTRQPNLPEP